LKRPGGYFPVVVLIVQNVRKEYLINEDDIMPKEFFCSRCGAIIDSDTDISGTSCKECGYGTYIPIPNPNEDEGLDNYAVIALDDRHDNLIALKDSIEEIQQVLEKLVARNHSNITARELLAFGREMAVIKKVANELCMGDVLVNI
jgi:ribosomal protein S27AE